MEAVFWISFYLAVHPLCIYPLSLVLLIAVRRIVKQRRKTGPLRDHSIEEKLHASPEPRVALLISTHNEARFLERKLQNSQNLDYPGDRIHFYLLSDACTDETDAISRQFPNTTLLRTENRKGKSAVIEEFISQIDADILVFSDANSLYEPDAIRFLIAPLHDQQVGYVVGHQKYCDTNATPAVQAENTYWNCESWLKTLESSVASVVGGDGAIYAIRRKDYVSLDANDVSDLYIPLQLVIRGFQGVYEPRAICTEHASARFAKQFQRKARIINRSLHSTSRSIQALNPGKVGLFSYLFLSHKVLRWLTPCNTIVALGSLSILAGQDPTFYRWFLLPPLLVLVAATLYAVPSLRRIQVIYISFYACAMNVAAWIGVGSFLFGYRVSTWQPDRE